MASRVPPVSAVSLTDLRAFNGLELRYVFVNKKKPRNMSLASDSMERATGIEPAL